MTSEPGPAADLPRVVGATRRELEDLLARLDPDRPAPCAALPERPVVALVGAPGRGRHALLAALLGLDAAPRRAPLRVVHTAHAADGGPGEVALDVPLLEELDLWLPDRDAGPTAASGATAALVLADAAAPLRDTELDALVAVADRVDAVVPALTGIESHRGWRVVLDADRALLGERVPRLAGAPWFPCSPVLAARARALPPGPAAALRHRCGVAELQRELHRLVARRRRMLGEANALRVLSGELAAVATRAEDTLRALDAPGSSDDLTHRRDRLLAARAALRRDRHTRWRADLATARVAAADRLGVRVRELATRARARIDEADRAGLAAVPDAVADEVSRLAEAVVDDLGARLRALVGDTLADLLPRAEIAALRVVEPPRPRPAPTPPPRRADDRLLVVAGASGGLGLSRLALLPLLAVPVAPALSAALVPVSVGLGLGAAGWMARSRRLAADRAHLRQWLAEALAEVRADLERVVADALIDAEREVTLALDAALGARAADLDAAVAVADRAVRARGARRADLARTVRRTASEARAGRDRAERVLAHLARLRDRL